MAKILAGMALVVAVFVLVTLMSVDGANLMLLNQASEPVDRIEKADVQVIDGKLIFTPLDIRYIPIIKDGFILVIHFAIA